MPWFPKDRYRADWWVVTENLSLVSQCPCTHPECNYNCRFVCSEELSIFCYRANTVKAMWRNRGQNLEQSTWLLGTEKFYWEEHSRSGNKMCLQGKYSPCLRRQRNPSPVNAWFCARGTSKWHSRSCYTLHSLYWWWTCLVTAATKVLLYWETDSGIKLPGCASRGKAKTMWPDDYSSKVL